MIHGLDLFSGIGGLSLALSPWTRTVAYCEIDRYAQAVLLSRMRSGELEVAPIWDDVTTLRAQDLPPIDIIYGGFPCQDISSAGLRKGVEGERSGLVFDVIRLVSECRPAFVFLENVSDFPVRGLGRVLLELHALGYGCRWTTLSACEIGGTHLRRRTFALAYANGDRPQARLQWNSRRVSLPSGFGRQRITRGSPSGFIQPRVDRTGDGIPHRAHRIRALGNAVVPLQARTAFKKLMGLEES